MKSSSVNPQFKINRLLEAIGRPFFDIYQMSALAFSLAHAVFRQLLTGPWRGKEILEQSVKIGVESLPIVVSATAFAGIVVTHEIAWHMNVALSNVTMIPGFSGLFILRELGVIIPAFLIISKVGAAITAEISTMKITEQIDALRLLKINPVVYLVFPRWCASIFSLVCLTMISIFVTLLCALAVSVGKFHFNVLEYLTLLQKFVSLSDLFCALIKAAVFGATIPLIACAYGFRCRGGAQGVGMATTHAVVACTLTVIVQDFILTYLFVSFIFT